MPFVKPERIVRPEIAGWEFVDGGAGTQSTAFIARGNPRTGDEFESPSSTVLKMDKFSQAASARVLGDAARANDTARQGQSCPVNAGDFITFDNPTLAPDWTRIPLFRVVDTERWQEFGSVIVAPVQPEVGFPDVQNIERGFWRADTRP